MEAERLFDNCNFIFSRRHLFITLIKKLINLEKITIRLQNDSLNDSVRVTIS